MVEDNNQYRNTPQAIYVCAIVQLHKFLPSITQSNPSCDDRIAGENFISSFATPGVMIIEAGKKLFI
jgi:hypothetical protein